jgi:hypothetical protein
VRVFGQYIFLDEDVPRILPVCVSFRHLQLSESITPTQIINPDEIRSLAKEFYTADVLKNPILVKYDARRAVAETYKETHGAEEAEKYLARQHYKLRNDVLQSHHIKEHKTFEDKLLDNFFGYHVGMNLFLNECATKGYTTLAEDVAMLFAVESYYSMPDKWKEQSEIFRLLGARIRFDEDALNAYGRFLGKA